ncbi:hypothetical protein HF668_03605 [Acidithiobacillus ferridurans]|uniref:hypothetical protein n=1 Tax=Acidithiobacillus ferridurans TaxID=1232575 RepID=UPI001C06AE8A|nr:hypothetical protein [Acidithiobacillus ferridurans]MBU2804255.1 hypothetical protein [Acidithiobacillus ferridurans]
MLFTSRTAVLAVGMGSRLLDALRRVALLSGFPAFRLSGLLAVLGSWRSLALPGVQRRRC